MRAGTRTAPTCDGLIAKNNAYHADSPVQITRSPDYLVSYFLITNRQNPVILDSMPKPYPYTLAIFDIDGTLTEIKPEVLARNPRLVSPNKRGQQQALPGAGEKLAELSKAGVKIALATNRGGVAWGYNTLAESEDVAREAAELCGIPDAPIYLCPYHAKARGPRAVTEFAREDGCRKPNPGMLLEAMADAGADAGETIFVGDMDSDREAAENAGVRFFWAGEFFS